ncbi:toll/interleukin-1 receptor domain-containing protein [Streptomyces sp. YIM S03343]
MDGVNLALAVVGVVVAVVSAYFAYLPVRDVLWRRRRTALAPASDPGPQPPEGQEPCDVFVSYADQEADAARRLAGPLREAGLSVFLVRWVEPGLTPLLEAERALGNATLGVLLLGRTTMADLKIRDEYAALLARAHDGGLRLVPALVARDVELPPFAAVRQPVDLSGPGGAGYDAAVAQLVRIAVRERRRAGT